MNLDRDAVEAERDFLLRSLDDLDAERAEGNIDNGTYQTLHDDYTARAAAAIRSLDAIHEFGAAARLDPSQPEPQTYAGWAGALLAQQVKDAQARRPLLDASLARVSEVTQKFPDYPDAHALKGVILYRFRGDAKD